MSPRQRTQRRTDHRTTGLAKPPEPFQIRPSIVAGGLLAFGLSFDEIVVTLYLAGNKITLPLWIYNNITRPVNLGAVYVVGSVVLLVSIIPVYIAQRLAGGETLTPGRMGGTALPTAGVGGVG